MAKVDVDTYRKTYLSVVEERLMSKKSEISNFTTENLHRAIMTEMNRADEITWEIEIPDNMDSAIKDAEGRCITFMKGHKDMGVGKSY